MNLSNVAFLAHTAELSLADKGITSAKVVLTGFIIVFLMLILLIFIIKIYSSIVTAVQNAGTKSKKKNVKQDQTITKTEVTAAPVIASETQTLEDGVSDEVVAVISAAVAAMYDSPSKARIKSIKKSSNGGRSAWANAGVLDNTRPF